MTILRTDGSPNAGSGEKASAISVHARNKARGSEIFGQRSGKPESRSAESAKARRMVEMAMERRMVTTDAQESHRASRFKNCGGTKSEYPPNRVTLFLPPLYGAVYHELNA